MSEKEKQSIHSAEKSGNDEKLEQLTRERHEVMRERLERAEQAHKERSSETELLAEAQALTKKEEKDIKPASPAERRRGPLTKKQLAHSFDTQMKEARTHMSPGAQLLSKFIHSRPIEAASDIASSTIARPNALLSGSVAAFLLTTIIYFTAKHYGFQLSGFETIGAFIFGWILGVLYDYFLVMIRGQK